MAGKMTGRVSVPYGTAAFLSSLRDFRFGAREPSAKALGYFQQNFLCCLTHFAHKDKTVTKSGSL